MGIAAEKYGKVYPFCGQLGLNGLLVKPWVPPFAKNIPPSFIDAAMHDAGSGCHSRCGCRRLP